jgi:predicted ATPase with chaperone activity
MSNKEIREIAKLSNEAKDLLDTATSNWEFRLGPTSEPPKLHRTIADLDNEHRNLPKHISEALQYSQQVFI